MSIWLLASLLLLPSLAVPVFVACRGTTPSRFVALQLAIALTIPILVLLTFVFDQPSFIDLPLALAVLNLPGALLIALFLERWV